MTEDEHLSKIDVAIRSAERLIALADIPSEEEDAEAYWDSYDTIFHCEVCTIREVMTVVWPPVQNYIDWLKSQIPSMTETTPQEDGK